MNKPVDIPARRRLLALCNEVIEERDRQDEKWGADRDNSPGLWITILGEEFGEVCRAVLERDRKNLREELIQVAAVALAMAEDLDRSRS